jgi:hypothetical protein
MPVHHRMRFAVLKEVRAGNGNYGDSERGAE